MDTNESPFGIYKLQITAQERKIMISRSIRELRKVKGYPQKKVAELLKISPQTYNGYETGRNEPPAEILVRLSYLYDVPVDLIVQRNILNSDSESASNTINKFEAEIKQIRDELENTKYRESIQIQTLIDSMEKLSAITKEAIEKNNI